MARVFGFSRMRNFDAFDVNENRRKVHVGARVAIIVNYLLTGSCENSNMWLHRWSIAEVDFLSGCKFWETSS